MRLTLALALALAAASPALAQSTAELRELAANFGLTPQQARQVFARYDAQAVQIAALADNRMVDRRLLRSAALALGASKPNLAGPEFLRLVEAKADEAKAAQTRIVELEALVAALKDGAVRAPAEAILREGRAAFDAGRLEDSDKAFARLEFLRRSEAAGARDAWREVVATQIDVLALAGKNEAASAVADRAIQDIANQARQDSWDLANQNGLQWLDRGTWPDEAAALDRALGIFRKQALAFAPPEFAPLDWARTQHNIGTALYWRAILGGDAADFDAAIAAYRAGLEKASRDRSELDWAMIQESLCETLFRSGARSTDARLLGQGAAACQAALEATPIEQASELYIRRREQLVEVLEALWQTAPPDPLLEEACLGSTPGYFQVDDLSADEASKATLATADLLLVCGRPDLAEPRYRAVLDRLDRRRAPLDWARAQAGLGNSVMAALQLDPFGLTRPLVEPSVPLTEFRVQEHDAVEGYRLALEELDPEKTPVEWLPVQRRLGRALTKLGIQYAKMGERTTAAKLSAEAVEIFERVVDWHAARADAPVVAAAKVELTHALIMRYVHGGGMKQVDEAITLLEPVGPTLRLRTAPWVSAVREDVRSALESARDR